MNWDVIFNRLWRIIGPDQQSPAYYKGARLLDALREVDPNVPSYPRFIAKRQAEDLSTTRKEFFYELLMALDEPRRFRAVNGILQAIEGTAPEDVAEIRGQMQGAAPGPAATVPQELWSAGRLTRYLDEIDAEIIASNYERAVALSYTCLEGFFKACFRAKMPDQQPPDDILDLARWARKWLKEAHAEYPDEVLSLSSSIAHAIDRARNRFSEAHFAGEGGRWLAVYVRDLVNTQIRLLLHFL